MDRAFASVYNRLMSLNCREIDEIIGELSLEGSFIQDIVQPGYDTLAFFVYGKGGAKTVLVCTAPNACRIHETRRKISRNDKPLRFMECLRAQIKGARIESCAQIALNRIIAFRLSHGAERFTLYIRLWSNAANVILCAEDNAIIDTMFRRPAKGEVSGGIFTLPAEKHSDTVWQLRQFEEVEREYAQTHPDAPQLSFNRKVDLWYGEHALSLSRDALLLRAQKWYGGTRTRMEGALERLIAKQESFRHAEQYKTQGDLILSNAHRIDKKSSTLECVDYTSGKTILIPLERDKTAQENAALYYERYKKQKSGAESILHDIEIARTKLQKLDALYQKIVDEPNPVKIEQLLRRSETPKQKQKRAHPGLDYTVDGWYILVGRDAGENDELLRRHVRGSDLWLHVRDAPGGYVFIKNRPGKTVPLDILLDAANLALYYSKARNAGKADLYYTAVKYLRRAKNAPKGTVLPTHEKNLCIVLDKARLMRLDKLKQEESI